MTVRYIVRDVGTTLAGLALGWLIYMVGMVLTVYDGVLSLIFQPIMAALFSVVFVVAALIVGLPLRIPAVARLWGRLGWWAVLISVASIGVLAFGTRLGLREWVIDPDTKRPVETIPPLVGGLAYFFSIFPIVNLPRRRASNQSPNPGLASVTPPSGADARHP